MLQTGTTPGPDSRLEPLAGLTTVQLRQAQLIAIRHGRQREVAIDDTLEASFPASDPPAWTAGIASAGPAALRGRSKEAGPAAARARTDAAPQSSGRTTLQVLASLTGAVGIALLAPFAILLVGLPIALAARGILEVFLWLSP